MNTTTYTLPALWASALINGDFSGLPPADTEYRDAWLHIEQPGAGLSCSDEPFFSRRHDAFKVVPMACGCLEYTFRSPS